MIPNRSSKGCLTCKRRRKKCDEKKPECDRCLLGGFECFGYPHLFETYSGTSANNHKETGNQVAQSNVTFPLLLQDRTSRSSTDVDQLSSPALDLMASQMSSNTLALLRLGKRSPGIPKSPQLDPLQRNNIIDLIVSQYLRVASRASFKPVPGSFSEVLATRARSSVLTLKTMYLGARIVQALLDETNWYGYVGWIDNFHRQISGIPLITIEAGVAHLADRLSAHQGLEYFTFMLLGSSAGYSLFRKSIPLFLQLAAKYPEVWAQDSAISISHALHTPRHEITKFILVDTISAVAFGTAPLVNYNTTIHEEGVNRLLERWYFCPMVVLILLASINSARIARLMDQSPPSSETVRDVEAQLWNWNPVMDYANEPPELITRLAIWECWRQSTLIYLYMGMCGVDSADERIRPLVSQIAQLARTVEAGTPLEAHLFVPCLIAGVAARKEKHRAILRRKMLASQKIEARLLRGADFVFVLDHLWHGAAAGGNAITWEDYVNSRHVAIPIDI